MAGPRQAAAVVIGNGRKHFTKAEIEERQRSDALARQQREGEPKAIRAPSWLPEGLRKEFASLRAQLVDRGLMCQLDRDSLAFYLMAREEYVNAGKMASDAIGGSDVDGAKEWSAIQDRYFKQARACANDLGLTVTSRCRLVLPPREEEPEDEFTTFLNRRRVNSE